MITNKDIRVENGNLVLNGDKFPLDGQSPETIMEIVEDNSDTTPTENSTAPITSGGVFTADKAISDTIGDITQTGVTGATVAAQLGTVGNLLTAMGDIMNVQRIPYVTDTLTSIKNAFENGIIPINVTGFTIGAIDSVLGQSRVIFIAQNQTYDSTHTRYAAIYFGVFEPPRYCYKQDSAAWVDKAL